MNGFLSPSSRSSPSIRNRNMTKYNSLISFLMLAFLMLLTVSCARSRNPVLGKWVQIGNPAHQLIITKQGDTLIVEEINTALSGLNSKTPATYKDGVIRLESGFGRQNIIYDAATDRLSTQTMIGKIDFKRQ